MSAGRLVVCPTPIGNLEDVTLRVLAALREADVVACEDTRHTRVLLERYGVSAKLVSYHEHNERARAAELVEQMLGGAVVALVSDAGMPLVSDPGFPLVQGCVAAGLAVEVLPGPSSRADRAGGERAAVRRLALRGLPPAQARRRSRPSSRSPETLVAFESPRRIGASLAVLAELDPERPVAVCRELTKLHEEIVRGTAPSSRRSTRPRRRAARSCSSSAARRARDGLDPAAVEAVRTLVESGARAKTAAKVVAELTGAPANALYRDVAT